MSKRTVRSFETGVPDGKDVPPLGSEASSASILLAWRPPGTAADIVHLVRQILEHLAQHLRLPGVLLYLPTEGAIPSWYALGLFAHCGVPDAVRRIAEQDLPATSGFWQSPLDATTAAFFRHQATDLLVVPVVSRQERRGTLVVLLGSDVTDTRLLGETLSLYGHILAHVFTQAQLTIDLHTLLEATRHLVESDDLNVVLERLLHYAVYITYTEAASILLHDVRAGKLTFAAAIGPNADPLQRIRVPLNSLAGKALRTHEPIIIQNVAETPDHWNQADAATGFHTRSLVAMPIFARGRPIGVIEVLNKRRGHFTAYDVQMLQALAYYAGAVIYQAQLMREREQALRELQVLDERKTQFIHLVSHELRTPLTIIRGYTEMLQEEIRRLEKARDDPPVWETLHMLTHEIMEGVRRLSVVVEEITQATLTSKVLDPSEMQDVDLRELLQRVMDEVNHLSRTKGLRMVLDVPSQPVIVRGQPDLLYEAVVQVVGNAVKFTPEAGRVIVALWDDDTHAMIRVSDTGPGIPPEELERIFQPFYQVEHPLTRQHPGLGLGLTITKQAMERHGGDIWVESTPGAGSVFTLVVPKS